MRIPVLLPVIRFPVPVNTSFDVPDEFKNWLFRGEGTACVNGRVSRSYELFQESEVLITPIRHHDMKVGC